MRRNTPLLTLLTGAALGVILLIASMLQTPVKAPASYSARRRRPRLRPPRGAAAPRPRRLRRRRRPHRPPRRTGRPVRADYAGRVKGGGATVAIASTTARRSPTSATARRSTRGSRARGQRGLDHDRQERRHARCGLRRREGDRQRRRPRHRLQLLGGRGTSRRACTGPPLTCGATPRPAGSCCRRHEVGSLEPTPTPPRRRRLRRRPSTWPGVPPRTAAPSCTPSRSAASPAADSDSGTRRGRPHDRTAETTAPAAGTRRLGHGQASDSLRDRRAGRADPGHLRAAAQPDRHRRQHRGLHQPRLREVLARHRRDGVRDRPGRLGPDDVREGPAGHRALVDRQAAPLVGPDRVPAGRAGRDPLPVRAGIPDYSTRVLIHSLLGCAFFGAFTVKMLILPNRPAWLGAAGRGRRSVHRAGRLVVHLGLLVLFHVRHSSLRSPAMAEPSSPLQPAHPAGLRRRRVRRRAGRMQHLQLQQRRGSGQPARPGHHSSPAAHRARAPARRLTGPPRWPAPPTSRSAAARS